MVKSKEGILLPNGFSAGGQKRIENAMIKKAMEAAAKLPQLPPELGAQVAQGIGMAIQGKVTHLMVTMNTGQGEAAVRVMIFRDELFEQMDKGKATIKPIAPVAPVPSVDEVAQKILVDGKQKLAEEAESQKQYEVQEPPKESNEQVS